MLTPAKALDEAADYVLEHGMARRAFVAEDGSVCAMGAIQAAISTHEDEEVLIPGVVRHVATRTLRHAATAVLAQEVPGDAFTEDPAIDDTDHHFTIVTRWNDLYCRDKEELALMLRAAAKNAEASE